MSGCGGLVIGLVVKLSFLEILSCFTNYWILVCLISHEFLGTDLVRFRSSSLDLIAFLALGISIDIPSPISLDDA